MTNERIEGTILVDVAVNGAPHTHGNQTYAECTIPEVRDVLVDYAGEITYAVTGERGNRMWWFAGVGNVAETL